MKRHIINIVSITVTFFISAFASAAAEHNGGTLSGTLVLQDNTYLLNMITVSGNLTIDLNGYVLTYKKGYEKEQVIDVPGGATLTIKDSRPSLGHEGYINSVGLFAWPRGSNTAHPMSGGIIYNPYKDASTSRKGIAVSGTCKIEGGKIAGCYTPRIGAAITCSSSGTLIMTGGEILYNQSKMAESEVSGIIYGEITNKNNGSRINLSNVTISHNKTEGNGGAICGYNVTLTNCTIQHNSAGKQGGAIYVRSGDPLGNLSIDGCTIINNTAALEGGAIYTNNSVPCTIKNSTISYNTSASSGGGINATGTLNIENSTISYNEGVNGGGIRVSGACTISGSGIHYNYATTNGGGIHSTAGTVIRNSTIKGNRAMSTETGINDRGNGVVNRGRGGGFCFSGNKTTNESDAVLFVLDNTEVSDNACMYYGGGGHLENAGKLTVQNNTKINGNTSVLKGAAGLHLTGGVFFYMKETCVISGNVALGGVGGGIHSSYECALHLDGGTVSENIVYGRGGGVHVNTGGDIILNGTDITDNKAYDGINLITSTVSKGSDGKYVWSTPVGIPEEKTPGYGGGLLINSGSCTMNKGNLSRNYAKTLGGGIAMIMTRSGEYAHHVRLANFTLNSGNVSDNTTDGNGAGIYLMENILTYLNASEKEAYTQLVAGGDWTPKIILNGGTISGNIAKNNGGGAYQEQKTEFILPADKNAVLSGNKASDSGGAVYIAKGKFTVNGSASVTNNRAVNGNGGAIYLGQGTVDSPSVFTVGNNGRLILGGNGSTYGNIAGMNGGGVYCSGSFVSNGESVMQNNHASNGAGVYVSGANADFNGLTSLLDNTATGNGGAVYVDGGQFSSSASITMTSNQAGADGGAVYIKGTGSTKGNIDITGASTVLTLSGNSAAGNGGVFYVDGGSIDAEGISRAEITDNYCSGEGGAFYVNNGDITMCKSALSGNGKSGTEVKTTNGGAIALYNGIFSFADGSEIINNAASGNGGALYVKNSTADQSVITCTGGSYIANTAGLGGGIYASGPIKLTFAANVRDNKAQDGGGLYLDEGVNMSFGNGLIVGNSAEKTGGGIYLSKGKLTFTSTQNLGIYNNAASIEAADIYSSGSDTRVDLPNVTGMNLIGFEVPGSDLYWVKDFADRRYETALRNNEDIETMILDFEGSDNLVLDNRQCLDLGYDLVFVTLNVLGLKDGDNAAVTISYPHKTTGNATEYRKIVLAGNKQQIVGLPSNQWQFHATPWSFTYDIEETYTPEHSSITDASRNLLDGYIYIKRNHNQSITITFSQSDEKKNLNTHDNIKVNIMRPGGSL